jgi:hypothetical protein
MEFEIYLTTKKIDASSFKDNEPLMFDRWKKEFDLMHENSFTEQKKFQINKIRRKHQLVHQRVN